MIAFLCPGCGKSLKVKDELAGRKGRCPHCLESMTVPTARAEAEPERGEKSSLRRDGKHFDFLAPPQLADEIGRLGSYRVLKALNVGDRTLVLQAEDSKLNRVVALKVLLPALAANPAARERFLRHARAAAAIEHDHLIPVFEVNEAGGVPYVTMPFLRGESLEERLQREGQLPRKEVFRIVREMAEGLGEVHHQGMMHGNLKPANIWLEGEKRRVKILDLGIARPARGEEADSQATAYLAPEQRAGTKGDGRSDLYSLGVVFYRMITGTLPFQGAGVADARVADPDQMPTAPRKLNPELSPRQSRLIMELLAPQPEDRPPSALSLVDLLDELESEPAQQPTGIQTASTAGGRVRRSSGSLATSEDEEYADEQREEEPAQRSLMVPLLIGGGVGCFGLLLIAGLGAFLMLRKSDTPDVAQNKNPPVDAQVFNPPPFDQNPVRPPNPFPNPNPNNETRTGNPNLGGNAGGSKEPPKDGGAPRPRELPPRKAALPEPDKQYKLHSSAVKGLLFAPDGKRVFSFAERNTKVDYWDVDSGQVVRSFELGGNRPGLNSMQFLISRDGSRLIAFHGALLLCWNVDTGKPLVTVTPPLGATIVGGGFTANNDVRAALVGKAPGGSYLAIYDHAMGDFIPVINPKTNKPVQNKKTKKNEPLAFPHPGTEVEQVFFSPDSKRFLSWSQDRMFRTWDIEQVRLLATSPAAPGMVKALAVSPDFKLLMGAFNQPQFHVYNVETGTEVKEIQPEGIGSTEALAFGTTSMIGVAARFGGTTRVYDVEEGTIKKEIKGIPFTSALALSPDGKTVLCGDSSGTISVFKIDQ